MEMPVDTPQERERAKRAATHYDLLERACLYYENQLRLPAGLPALRYLQNRGVTEDAIKTFRLGYAPDKRDGLRGELAPEGIAEQLMVEAGLLIRVTGDIIALSPPLIVEEEQVSEMVGTLREVLSETE